MHKFFHFAHLKSIFSILHTYFYKTPTSACLFYTFIQIKYSFLYPHGHRPTPTIHTGITPKSTHPTGRKSEKQTQQNGSKPTPRIHTGITVESTQPTGRKLEKQTQQNGSKPTPTIHTGITSESTQPTAENHKNKPSKMDQNPHPNRRLALSKMD